MINIQEDIGSRDNKNKLEWSLIDFPSLEPMVRVLQFGAKKYGKYNWKKGLKTTEICDSMLRHIFAYLNGEDIDEESGLPIEGHILCNAMFLAYMMKHKSELDNRYKLKKNSLVCLMNWDYITPDKKCHIINHNKQLERFLVDGKPFAINAYVKNLNGWIRYITRDISPLYFEDDGTVSGAEPSDHCRYKHYEMIY